MAKDTRSASSKRWLQEHVNDKYVKAKTYARTTMINSLGSDFGERLRAFEDFKLSGQVLERSPNFVGIDIGAREGISSDDVFWFMESVEEAGKTVNKKAGWVGCLAAS